MTVYILVFILLAFLSFRFDNKGNKKGRRKWEHFVVFILILIVGLRNHVGSDSIVYEWHFSTIQTPFLKDFFKNWFDYTDPLWTFVMSFCKTVFGSFIAVQFFHGIVFNVLVYRFIKKTTTYTFTALLITFCTIWFANSFEVLRESVCAGLFLNATLLLNEKKYAKYFIVAFIAVGFHPFSLIVFLLAPLVSLLSLPIFAVFVIAGTLFITVFDLSDVSSLMTIVMERVSEGSGERVMKYMQQKNMGQGSLLGYIRTVLLDYALPIMVILLSRDGFKRKMVLLLLFFNAITVKIPILYRMDNYLFIIFIVLLVNVLYEQKSQKRKDYFLILIFLTVSLCTMRMVDTYRPGPNEYRKNINYDCRYFPYTSVFQKQDPVRENFNWY